MRYYVEINGESSLDIQGLMIQSLPSISKPLMRSKQETIDGRDGDIVTKLGYSAYDKTLKIGLWGNYDINEVIAFFNQEGEIVFSNEPDKYYRFTILNREDYVSQLDKFRTCTIALHCQPYKYKLNEETEELENEYVEQEGTSATFTNTLEAPMKIDLKGNTSQTGTPTPSSPIPVNNVSGDNDIVVCGKNLLNDSNKLDNYAFDNTNNKVISANGYYLYYIRIQENETYVSSATLGTASGNIAYAYCNEFPQANTSITGRTTTDISILNNETFTTPSNVKYLLIRISKTGQDITNWQIEKNNQATPYEAYNGTTYNIDLPVENLIPNTQTTQTINGITLTNNNDGTYSLSGTATAQAVFQINPLLTDLNVVNGETYTYSANKEIPIGLTTRLEMYNGITWKRVFISDLTNNTQSRTATLNTTDANIIRQSIIVANGSTINIENIGIMLEKGSKVNSFTPYGTTPIELNKIGTYQDYFYKENDKWYLHKEIGKVVLNGSVNQTWTIRNIGDGSTTITFQYNTPIANYGSENVYCNNFSYNQNSTNGNEGLGIDSTLINFYIQIKRDRLSSLDVAGFKSWLSTHNTIVIYQLPTPTNTEITYTPLIEQLESINNAMSKKGTTNVNQVNNDAPFILDLSVLSGTDSITLTNEGNTTSKPTLTITGSGVVGVYLENIQMFNISLGTNETIIINTENMEAYYGSQLKNRQVTGDYSNFALQSGTNNLRFTGAVTSVEITNYNRWI